ncbi:MAG: tail protein X [Lachnospiraceae bacterium]
MIYKTKQGDMWDYIAWKVYGDEAYVNVLYNANPGYLKVFIFDDGREIICPEISGSNDNTDTPEWRDNENLEADALDGISDAGAGE